MKVTASELKKSKQLVIGQIYNVVESSGINKGKVYPYIFQGYRFTGDVHNPEDMLIFANLKGKVAFMQFAEFVTIEFK